VSSFGRNDGFWVDGGVRKRQLLTADSSAALRNDKQKSYGMANKKAEEWQTKRLRNGKQKSYGMTSKMRYGMTHKMRCGMTNKTP
jgi:hypothetical protein